MRGRWQIEAERDHFKLGFPEGDGLRLDRASSRGQPTRQAPPGHPTAHFTLPSCKHSTVNLPVLRNPAMPGRRMDKPPSYMNSHSESKSRLCGQLNELLALQAGLLLLPCLAALVLAFTGPVRAETLPAAIPFSDIGARATAAYQGDALGVTATADGARLRCGFQKLEGRATPEGLWLESTKPGRGKLRLIASSVVREQSSVRSAISLTRQGLRPARQGKS